MRRLFAALERHRETTEEELVLPTLLAIRRRIVEDLPLTSVVDGDLVKVVAWYDNEWGYSTASLELALFMRRFRNLNGRSLRASGKTVLSVRLCVRLWGFPSGIVNPIPFWFDL